MPPELDSADLFSLASNWLRECQSKHTRCAGKISSFRPTRVLDLLSLPEGKIHLIVTTGTRLASNYGTLSHCWGKAKTLKLLSTNLDTFQDGIAVDDLPTSYKEALLVASRLDIRYLWIDSLCILQDSEDDWLCEAGMMGEVYRHSYLNIALAGAAENSEASFTERHAEAIRPAYIEAHWDDQPPEGHYIIDEEFQSDLNHSKLRSRGWVLQEVFLAPRVLYLGKSQMWYECIEGVACETYPGWVPSAWTNQTGSYSLQSARQEPANHLLWDSVVEAYSSCDLTVLSDRMIAISGVANFFRQALGDEYMAGLWKSQLPAELMWRTKRHRTTVRTVQYRAPSWSWCSIEGDVEFLHRPMMAKPGSLRTVCEVTSAVIELADPENAAGLVKGGFLGIKGALHPVIPWHDGRLDLYYRDSGTMKHVEISQSVRNYYGGQRASVYWEGDECDDDGGFSFEYAHEEGDLKSVEDIKRPKLVGAFCLPVIAFEQHGFPYRGGLLLQQLEHEPDVYERIGNFEARGVDECACFPTDQRALFRIV